LGIAWGSGDFTAFSESGDFSAEASSAGLIIESIKSSARSYHAEWGAWLWWIEASCQDRTEREGSNNGGDPSREGDRVGGRAGRGDAGAGHGAGRPGLHHPDE